MAEKLTRLGNVIEKILASMGQGNNYHGWRIVSLWPEIVGSEIARSSRAVRFAEGVLTVVVEKDVWRQELELQRDEILSNIRSQPGGGVVKKIVLRAGPVVEKKNESGS